MNGIPSRIFFNGREIKGIIFLDKNNGLYNIFLDKNNDLCFISSVDDDKEIEIIRLDNIKKIYFNVKGSMNLENYVKKIVEEKFIQIIEIIR